MNLEETLKSLQELHLLEMEVTIPIRATLYEDGRIDLKVDDKEYNGTIHLKLKQKPE